MITTKCKIEIEFITKTQSSSGVTYEARLNDTTIGTITMKTRFSKERCSFRITKLYVNETFRNLGIASQLLNMIYVDYHMWFKQYPVYLVIETGEYPELDEEHFTDFLVKQGICVWFPHNDKNHIAEKNRIARVGSPTLGEIMINDYYKELLAKESNQP